MGKWFEAYNREYNDQLTEKKITSWDAHSFVKKECGKKIYKYLEEPGFYRNLEPIPHSIEVIQRLQEKYDIYIVTTSPKNALKDKAEWIEEHLPFIGFKRMVYTHHKHLVDGDLLFDDAPHNLEAFQQKGSISVAMDYAYNRNIDCYRVSNWLEFEATLDTWLR